MKKKRFTIQSCMPAIKLSPSLRAMNPSPPLHPMTVCPKVYLYQILLPRTCVLVIKEKDKTNHMSH